MEPVLLRKSDPPVGLNLLGNGLIENERVLVKNFSSFTIQFYVARSVYGSKNSMQHSVAFRDENPTNQE
jgi:hypothetical protein